MIQHRPRIRLLIIVAVLFAAFPLAAQPARAAAPELFFSEYIEGSSNNKALEIYNGTGVPVALAPSGYSIQMYFNGSSSAGLTINLIGTVASGDVFVLAHSGASAAILSQADHTNSAGWFNGDDAVVLRRGAIVIDVVGQLGFDPGTEWGSSLTSTADNTLRREAAVCSGDINGSDPFDPSAEWEGFATDTFGGLGTHTASCGTMPDAAPAITSTMPTDGATNVSAGTNIVLNFSEPVNVVAGQVAVECPAGTVVATNAAASNVTSLVIDPAGNLPFNTTCTVTVPAGAVRDMDGNDPPDTLTATFTTGFTTEVSPCEQRYTPVGAIQGSGAQAAITGSVTTQGVVVGDYEVPSGSSQIRGFYLQDQRGDGNAATSDGIFVFTGGMNQVNLGDVVRVTGSAGEFQGQTQIGGTVAIVTCGTGSVNPVEVSLPLPSADYLERYEGMLVTLPQTLYVTEHFQLGRFGQVLLSSGGRLPQPTNIFPAGEQAEAQQIANNLNQIILDDDTNQQNPSTVLFARGGQPLSASNTLRGGDTTTGVTGVLVYSWGGHSASPNAYRVRAAGDLDPALPNFQAANPRPTTAPAVAGNLKVASFNVLNYFVTLDYPSGNPLDNKCGPSQNQECRGADFQTASSGREADLELQRQRAKLIAALLKLDADIYGLIELENTAGVEPIADIVAGLNAATKPGTFAYVDTATIGTDAIKLGLVYKPAKVSPVGAYQTLDSGDDPRFLDNKNRPSLAQTFEQPNGARFTVLVNHLKSKGSSCDDVGDPDRSDGQGNCNQTRLKAAQALADWLAKDPTGSGDTDYLIIGDLNSYAKEDPILALERAGFVNLAPAFQGPKAYSYVFGGQWGSLDHAMASASLFAQVTGADDYHINSDEPSVLDYNVEFKTAGQIASFYKADEFRTSDHDPVLVGLNLATFRVIGGGVLQPINQDGTSVFKYGRTVPVKLQLQALDNSFPAKLAPKLRYQLISGGTPGLINEPESSSAADTTGVMRFDAASNQYIYNLATHSLPQSGKYRLFITIPSSGQVITADFTVR